jgi:uncharacterized protein (UPF0218 family)
LAKLYRITKELRTRLKRPLGTIVKVERPTINDVNHLIAEGTMIASVGDTTTENMIRIGVIPAIQIVDGREKRKVRRLPKEAHKTLLQVRNPAGTISSDAIEVIERSFSLPQPVRILVDGEEDLLALPLTAICPEGSVVFYGQPKKGLVAIKVNRRKRQKALSILKEIGAKK